MARDQAAQAEILARLQVSREEIRVLLDPPPIAEQAPDEQPGDPARAHFPRSRTMRALMSAKGLTSVGVAAAGLLMARPAMAVRLLKMLPASAFARMLLVRAITSFRARAR